jgi:hypothetical protein
MAKDLERSAHSSALKFNYLLRPRKGVERKMLCESFHRLCYFHSLKDYEYIGFGAFYFADFKVFHRHLGIRNMLSIEHDPSIQKRVRFNQPYPFLKIKSDSSTTVLSKHHWRHPTIAWLDYDSVLKTTHLKDLEYVVQNAQSGSVVLLTSDADPKALDGRIPDKLRSRINTLFGLVMPALTKHEAIRRDAERLFKDCGVGDVRLAALKKRLDDNVPSSVTENHLDEPGYSKVLANLIKEEITRNLHHRNATLPSKRKLRFEQLYHFTYADGRRMLTYGGMLVDSTHEKALQDSGILNLDFVRSGEESFEIDTPELTVKELKFLEKYVPRQLGRQPTEFEMSKGEFRTILYDISILSALRRVRPLART